ncbi:MAG: carbohydrate porin [Syntrophobacteraceae bacterium]
MRKTRYKLCLTVLMAVSAIMIACPVLGQDSVEPEQPAPVPARSESSREDSKSFPDWFPKLVGAQFNGIYQNMPPFHSPYEGKNSLSFQNGRGHDVTHTYGAYFGSQLAPGLQAYFDLELFQGNGVGDGLGLGGYVNGDVIRAGSSNLSKVPYAARFYLRYFLPLSSETERVERGQDQLAGDQPVSRWELKVGKMTPTDDFDQNRYANNNRTQFFNYDFLYNTAWDNASDIRGYSYGIVASLFQPRWRLAFGVYLEPTTANGANFVFIDTGELGYNLEFTFKPNDAGTVVRLLSYFNEARMGSYEDALALARQTGTVPSLLDVEKPGGTKYGLGLNFEQPLADDGETGLFGRMGWNDGHHETWAYTESDRHASLGAQVSGLHWKRPDDRLGVAYGVNGLSSSHKDYLAAGGVGILLGDGALNYGFEQVFEVYYRIQVCRYVQISPDFQFIQNPGYNSDRGPVEVYGLRLRVSF